MPLLIRLFLLCWTLGFCASRSEGHNTASGSVIGFETSAGIGGLTQGLQMDQLGRVTQTTGPGSSKTFTHSLTSNGMSVSMSDSLQGTNGSFVKDTIGDAMTIEAPGTLPLSLSVTETGGQKKTTINEKLTIDSNVFGLPTARHYNFGGIEESTTYNSDGSVSEFSEAQSQAANTVVQTPYSITTNYGSGGTVVENFYKSGPRSSVTGLNDDRTFYYKKHILAKEVHNNADLWAGWTVEQGQDSKARLGSIKVTGPGGLQKTFTFQYDAYSRLNQSISTEVPAEYAPRNALGQLTGLYRGTVETFWSYYGTGPTDPKAGLLAGVTNSNLTGQSFSNTYPEYDNQRRITQRLGAGGIWSSLAYDTQGLRSASLENNRMLAYDFTTRGTRSGQASDVSYASNDLDQVTQRTNITRSFALMGTVSPSAKLAVLHSLSPIWSAMAVNPSTGAFYGWWSVPDTFNGGNAGLISARLHGAVPPASPTGTPATAETTINVVVPPKIEPIGFTATGSCSGDAYWNYYWLGPERLSSMLRKQGTFSEPGVMYESVGFTNDADGRRTYKTHTVRYTTPGKPDKVEYSKVLWCGWLPIMERRSSNGGATWTRRWFQWGVDLSGSLAGAGGINGLVAIIEETDTGTPIRTLLPVTDGLGNITAVINAANGATVATYAYGPFGEPLGETGEVDACPFRWQTKWYDAESQHYYFGYRYYSPRLGRWLSRDPLREEGGFNLYAYCGNDPVNRHDPLGLADKTQNSSDIEQLLALIMENSDASRDEAVKVAIVLMRDMEEARHIALFGPPRPKVPQGMGPFWAATKRTLSERADLAGEGLLRHDRLTVGKAAVDNLVESVVQISGGFCPEELRRPFGTDFNSPESAVADFGLAALSIPSAIESAANLGTMVTKSSLNSASRFSLALPIDVASGGMRRGMWRLSEAGSVGTVRTLPPTPFSWYDSADLSIAGPGRGFSSFDRLKSFLGAPGEGKVWHHIVEQAQEGKFGSLAIHNTDNVIAIPEQLNNDLNALYSSLRPRITGSDTLTIRDWLRTKSLQQNYDFGRAAIHYLSTGQW